MALPLIGSPASCRLSFLSDRWHPAGRLYLFFLPHVSSLRSPNAKNKFAFALGDRKLPAGCLYLFFLPHAGRCHQEWWRSMALPLIGSLASCRLFF
jgi:hypothetical protein